MTAFILSRTNIKLVESSDNRCLAAGTLIAEPATTVSIGNVT